MAVLDNLIEALNANNFFLPVSVCVVVGAVLLFTVIKWLSKSDKQDTGASSFDVDDWDKENQGSLKKTKQKKVKATNAQADSGSNSARSKVTGKQSVSVKVASPSAKEKQADVKAKVSTKKQAASAVPSKSVQPANEIQGEWLVAGSKKKPKSKKTETNVQESKTKETKDQADRQTIEVEVVKTHKSVADIASKDIGQPHEALVNSLEREVALGTTESVYDTATGASFQAEEVVVSQPSRPSYEEPPAKNRSKEPLAVESGAEAGVVEGNMESDAVGKENKSKKSAKKKKSKVVVESTQVTDVVVEKTKVIHKQQDDSSKVTANIPSSSVTKPEAAPLVETVPRKSDSKHKKAGPKDVIVPDEAKIVGPDASKDVVKVAAKSVIKVASKDVPVASKPVVPDSSKVVANDASKSLANDASKVMANDASKDVANDASKDVVDASKKPVPDASVDGPTSKLVAFDELGLTENSADVGQPLLKKKKKARKDI